MSLLLILAQSAAPVAAAVPVEAPPAQGIVSYPASYFATQKPQNAHDMIDRLPGFSLDTGSSVRGFEGSAGNVLIDGERAATKTDSLDEILRRIPASEVERIDVIRGGAPGVDMQGKSVLANVIRKKGGSIHGLVAAANSANYDGRDVGAFRAQADGGLGRAKWELGSFVGKGVDDAAGDGPGFHVFADGRPRQTSFIDTDATDLNGFVIGAVEAPVLDGKLRVNGRWYRDKYKFTEHDRILTPAPGEDASQETDRTRETEAGATFTRPLGSKVDVELVALRHPKRKTIDSLANLLATPDRFQLDQHTVETIGRAVVKYRPTGALSLEAGAENAINTLDSRTGFSEGGRAVPLPAANVRVREDRGEAFVKGVWRPSADWTFDAGLRYEKSRLTSEGDLTLEKTLKFAKPRVVVSWAPTPGTQIRARVEREVGQLDFNAFVASASLNTASGVTAGNPDLNPEQAWVGELAVEQRFWNAGDVTLTVRHYEIKDAIDRGPVFTDGVVFDRPTNIGKGTKDELVLDLTMPLDRLMIPHGLLKGQVTRRFSQVTDPTTHGRREISALHPIDWNGHFSQDLPRWNASWGVDAFGAWRETYYRFNLIETVKQKTYVIPWVEWRPRPDINIRIELDNVTERGVRRTDLIFPGPRSAGGAPDIEDRDLQFGRIYYIRVRKTFGG